MSTETISNAADPQKVVMLDKMFGVPLKARDADVYAFTLARFEEFPNIWISSGAFTDMKKVSDGNPQYLPAIVAHFGYWVQRPRRQARGPAPQPRWMPLRTGG